MNFFLGDEENGERSEDINRLGNNGRVRLCDENGCTRAAPYGLFTMDGRTSSTDGNMLDSLRRMNIATSVVATAFFSNQNVDALQTALRHAVFRASGQEKLVVGRQSDIELGIIMRSTYLSDNGPASTPLKEHVAELNKRVMAFSVPTVLNEARMYMTYRQSIQKMPVPMQWGAIASQKGSRQLGLTKFF